MELTAALTFATIRATPMSPIPSMFEEGDPRASPAASSQESYVQPTLGHGLRIWWAFFWRNTVITAILFAAVVLVEKPWFEKGYIPDWYYLPTMRFGPLLITYAMAIPVFYMILRKKFRHFRIGLIPFHDGVLGDQVLPASIQRTLRIWWAFSWRAFILGLIVSFVASFPLNMIFGALSALLPELADVFAYLSQLLVGAAVGLFVIYNSILDEAFSDFQVCLLPRLTPTPAPSAATTPTAI
jgi:hypothetical protein